MTRDRLGFASVIAVVALLTWTVSIVAGGSDPSECGVLREYTAPDAGTSTAGSIAFGLDGPLETIAADATLVGATATNLSPGMVTCLTIVRDAGTITSLAFAPEGTIAGEVSFLPDFEGSGQDFYLVADLLPVPAEFLATNSGLAALIVVPAEAGVPTSITFQIDTSTGNPSGFTGTTTIAGPVVLLDSGDVMVGDATLTADLVDAAARAEFEAAVAAGVPATVTIDGVAALDPDSGGILVTITLSIEFEVPTPVATPSVSPTPSPSLLPNTALPADL